MTETIDLTLSPSAPINLTLQNFAGLTGPQGIQGIQGIEGPSGPVGPKGRWSHDFIEKGAIGDGLSDDTEALNRTAVDCYSDGGGSVGGRGVFRITNLVHLSPGDGFTPMDIKGDGYLVTQFILDGPEAEIRISDFGEGVSIGLYGSTSGGFSIKMINGATKGLTIGLSAGRQFADIVIQGTGIGTGLLIDMLQNSNFFNVTVQGCDIGCQLDNGCAGNIFYNAEFNGCRNELNITQTRGTLGTNMPSLNEFVGGHFEFLSDNLEAHLFADTGDSNTFWRVTFATSKFGPGENTSCAMIRGGYNWKFNNCFFIGWRDEDDINHGYGIDVDVPGFTVPILYLNDCDFVTLDCAYKIREDNIIMLRGSNTLAGVTVPYRDQDGVADEATENRVIITESNNQIQQRVPSGALAYSLLQRGEAGRRFWMNGDGSMYWGSGADYLGDISLYRSGPRRLHTDMQLEAETFSPMTIDGAPTDASFGSPPRDGSMCLDSTNHRLYVRDGGVWKYAPLT